VAQFCAVSLTSMIKLTLFSGLFLLCFSTMLNAQDVEFARKVVGDLCSEEMAGRGYVKGGARKAADYLVNEYTKNELLFWGANYEQSFGYQAVAYPHRIELRIDDLDLIPGEDFIVSPGCPIIHGVFNLVFVDSSTIDNPAMFKDFERTAFYKTFLVVDALKGKKFKNQAAADKVLKNGFKAKGLIYGNQEKLTWSVSMDWEAEAILFIKKGILKSFQRKLNITVDSEINDYNMSNIIGYVKGTKYPDSFIVITAHYDHLGMMGAYALFPGANDNASGVAMMLDLMHTIKEKPLEYSVAFMAFAGEEIGLLGSLYYTEKPLFPLSDISMLINLDLMGTGDKGMTVVNATLFSKAFQELQLINITHDYLPIVSSRGKAANSDHYYFTEKGVKAFFFYLMGDYKYYHDIHDDPAAITFSRYNQAYSLIYDFVCGYSAGKY
jgi:aminopeptidase YwaD